MKVITIDLVGIAPDTHGLAQEAGMVPFCAWIFIVAICVFALACYGTDD